MPYPTPFIFPIIKGQPLLIMSCSAVKLPTGDNLVRFANLYNGPMWLQVKASGYPLANVAALSALHGFLEPGMAIRTYDVEMDEEHSHRIYTEGCHVARLAKAVKQAGSAFVVGGKMYQEIARTAVRRDPELEGLIDFATGSYLSQRKQLGEWLFESTVKEAA